MRKGKSTFLLERKEENQYNASRSDSFMNRTTFQKIAVAVVIGGTLTAAQAQSRPQTQMPFLHPLFSNHAVLQRDLEVPVWGWADPGTDVTVEFAGQKVTAKAGNDGKWMLKLGKMGISAEPRTMKVTGTANNLTQTVEAKDILVGDVWFCSGQSNMEMGMKLCNAQADIDAANYPTLRLLMVPHSVQYQPQQTAVMSWEACTPQVLENKGVWGGYSATAFYFGRELNQTLNIPIGLIHSSWGGTLAEAWTSAEGLKPLKDFDERLKNAKSQIEKDPGNPHVCTALYNGLVTPVIPYGIMGTIWYQGCSNADRAWQYRSLLSAMIKDWRNSFQTGDFPFIIVQLASFMPSSPEPREHAWAEIRESQAYVAETVPNCGLAVTIDIGDVNDIHPKNKADVGRRLAYWALANTYAKRGMAFSGPVYKKMSIVDGTIRLEFDYDCGGLVARGNDGVLTGFAVAGEDKKFHWAKAIIQDDTILLYSPEVPNPVAARYAWDTSPVCNLYNKAGLPAGPFRTDDWPLTTKDKK